MCRWVMLIVMSVCSYHAVLNCCRLLQRVGVNVQMKDTGPGLEYSGVLAGLV